MLRKLPVSDVMSKKPVTIKANSTVANAAKVMKKNDIGSLVVLEKNRPVGIVTERDILLKVIAKEVSPKTKKVKSIMSSPVVTIPPNTDVTDAARKMAKLKIRRLPVVVKNELVGMVTESDILRVAPALIEITREYSRINSGGERIKKMSGFCEICMGHSDELIMAQGKFICSFCAEGR